MLYCIGLSYQTAPVQLRERLATSLEAFVRLGHEQLPAELAVLSTCNRFEVYAVTDDGAGGLETLIERATGVPRRDFSSYLYCYCSQDAVAHLCRVAAGLDSMILGEPQILGQVSQALETAREFDTLGPTLSTLFASAIRVGKRARTETAISRNPGSVSSLAAKLAQQTIANLSSANVLIIGAGEMAELTVESLRSRGTKRISVLNRTLERSERLAARWGAQALTYESLSSTLVEADVVISSTSAPHFIVNRERVQATMVQRPNRPLVLIDIAVPRDIDPAVVEVPNVTCHNIDDLLAQFKDGWCNREQEVPKVEAIVAEEVKAFNDWERCASVSPLIADLHAKADTIRRAEVEKTLRHLSHLADSDRRRIELLTISLVNKLLHDPTLHLKNEAANGLDPNTLSTIRHLFALAE